MTSSLSKYRIYRSKDQKAQHHQIRSVAAAIDIQRIWRGHHVRQNIKAVRGIFDAIEQEIHFQVFGAAGENIKEKILELEAEKYVLEKCKQLVLEEEERLSYTKLCVRN